MKRMMEAGREIDLVVFSNYLSTQDTDTNLKKNHLPRIHSFFLHSREKGKEKEKGKIGQRDGRWLREREREKKNKEAVCTKASFSGGGNAPFSKFVDDYHGFLINRP